MADDRLDHGVLVRQIGFDVGSLESAGSSASRCQLPQSPLKRLLVLHRPLQLPQLKLGTPKSPAMRKSISLITLQPDDALPGNDYQRLSRSSEPIAIPPCRSHDILPAAQLLEEAQASAEPHAGGSTQSVETPSASQLHPPATEILRAVELQLQESQDQALALVQHLRLELEQREEFMADCAAQRHRSDHELCFELDLNDRCYPQLIAAPIKTKHAIA